MKAATLQFRAWMPAWHEVWDRLAPRCAQPDCVQNRGVWRRVGRERRTVMLEGSRYCLDGCLDRALGQALQRENTSASRSAPTHRIPLGLLLLSRNQLTVEQLRRALEAQRTAGRGRIGEWLQVLGYAGEREVTGALARQWSCPILQSHALAHRAGRAPQIPTALLRSLTMAPVDFVSRTQTLHVAFGEGLDYNALYALERMLGCRTAPCLAVPSLLRRYFATLPEGREQTEIVFDRLSGIAELTRIVRSYAGRINASEIRMVRCGLHLWVRLFRSAGLLDLVVRSLSEPIPPASSFAHPTAFAV